MRPLSLMRGLVVWLVMFVGLALLLGGCASWPARCSAGPWWGGNLLDPAGTVLSVVTVGPCEAVVQTHNANVPASPPVDPQTGQPTEPDR